MTESTERKVPDEARRIMGTPEQAHETLVAKAKEWQRLRQPVMATSKELRAIEVREREARFQLANAALHWLWHEENPAPATEDKS